MLLMCIEIYLRRAKCSVQAAMLVEKDVITEYFTRICSELPASCLQGNVAYMRRVVTM